MLGPLGGRGFDVLFMFSFFFFLFAFGRLVSGVAKKNENKVTPCPRGVFVSTEKPYHRGVNMIPFIAARLRELRARHLFTQEQVAGAAGIGYKYYQLLESGRKKQIWVETVNRLAAVFQIELHEFFAPELAAKPKYLPSSPKIACPPAHEKTA
ncbi:MAG: helix-turn-helix domain-containing protein [Puniceicoccales bacterium]|nr:helix-turn-helix domain-containing protein [Puniceicoccales bacterium]